MCEMVPPGNGEVSFSQIRTTGIFIVAAQILYTCVVDGRLAARGGQAIVGDGRQVFLTLAGVP